MRLVDLTLDEPAANIALDEALLDEAEASGEQCEYLRLWSPNQCSVVVGQSARVADEVHVEFCERNNIVIIRRCSGGGAIVTGPGCLMYALILGYAERADLRMIDRAHRFVLGEMRQAFQRMAIAAEFLGQSDLTIGQLKFSGNSMRCKRTHFLYHGTLLYDFDLSLIPKTLKPPPRQPEYRQDRAHIDFVTNLNVPEASLRQAIIDQWQAATIRQWPETRTHELTAAKYSRREWNFKR